MADSDVGGILTLYIDIVGGRFDFQAFWDEKVLQDTVKLKEIANVVVKLIERMEEIQNIG